MENYTSDSSDSDNGSKLLDYAGLQLDTATIDYNLESFANSDKKPASDIETLILSRNHLDRVPDSIVRFDQLRVLDLSSNGLTSLMDIFASCPLLRSFICKNNRLRSESLPKAFSACHTLRELNLSGNQLTAFPEQVFDFTNLRYLYLGGNSISAIPKDIWKMSSLQMLSMGGNRLTEVPVTLGQLKQLNGLVLCDNRLESLPSNIASLHNLKSLMLHKNRLRTLPQEIVTLKNLNELSLRDNPLVVQFVSDMTHNPVSLVELAARSIKEHEVPTKQGDLPHELLDYLKSGHRCVNPKCKGVFFDSRVEHIKFVDFCGKYRIPLLQYLCSSKCASGSKGGGACSSRLTASRYMIQKVLLG